MAWPFDDTPDPPILTRIGPAGARPFPTVDLAEVAKQGIPEPTLVFNSLLYRGMLHSLAGPPDCGKSTLAYRAALDLLVQGERVVILDEEGGREVVTEKLLALGATPANLEHLTYCEFPSRSWDDADRAGLWELLAQVQPALVIVDSAGAFMAVAGQDENWAAHVGPFYKLLLSAARDHHTAIMVLDHVPKNEATGRYARGSGAKLQIVDVAFMVDAIKAFSRTQDGLLRLTVTKDRRGYLHRHHEVKVITEDGMMALEITRVEDNTTPGRPGMKASTRKVLEALEASTVPCTTPMIGDWIADTYGTGLRRETISRALSELCRDDLAEEVNTGGHNAKYWQAVTHEPAG